MLSFRDEEVRTLAREVMEKTGAPSMTAAVKQALKNEIARSQSTLSLKEKVDALRLRAQQMAVRPPEAPFSKEERDALWER